MRQCKIFTSALLLLCCTVTYSQKVTLNGYITDVKTGERLLGASIFVINKNLGTTSNTGSSSHVGETTSGPFVGVAPNNSTKSVLTYYGIDSHDRWIFTPLFRN